MCLSHGTCTVQVTNRHNSKAPSTKHQALAWSTIHMSQKHQAPSTQHKSKSTKHMQEHNSHVTSTSTCTDKSCTACPWPQLHVSGLSFNVLNLWPHSGTGVHLGSVLQSTDLAKRMQIWSPWAKKTPQPILPNLRLKPNPKSLGRSSSGLACDRLTDTWDGVRCYSNKPWIPDLDAMTVWLQICVGEACCKQVLETRSCWWTRETWWGEGPQCGTITTTLHNHKHMHFSSHKQAQFTEHKA